MSNPARRRAVKAQERIERTQEVKAARSQARSAKLTFVVTLFILIPVAIFSIVLDLDANQNQDASDKRRYADRVTGWDESVPGVDFKILVHVANRSVSKLDSVIVSGEAFGGQSEGMELVIGRMAPCSQTTVVLGRQETGETRTYPFWMSRTLRFVDQVGYWRRDYDGAHLEGVLDEVEAPPMDPPGGPMEAYLIIFSKNELTQPKFVDLVAKVAPVQDCG